MRGDASNASQPFKLARGSSRSPVTALTARERDVLRLLALGLSTTEITDRLGVSTNTVRTHVQHLMAKLGAHNRLQLTAIASEQGLLNQDHHFLL